MNARRWVEGGDRGGVDAGAPPPPIDPPEPRWGGGGGDMPPRRGYRQWLPWLALGALALAVERLALVTMAMAGLSPFIYAVAAAAFLFAILFALSVGGTAFYRAWQREHGLRSPGSDPRGG